MTLRKSASVILAVAVASAFAMPSFADAAHAVHGAKQVKCSGVNSCKGKSMCKTSANSCKGQNSCKGKGWLTMKNEKQCVKKGGTVVQ